MMTKLKSSDVTQDDKVDGEYGRIAEIVQFLEGDSLEDIIAAILTLSLQDGNTWTQKDIDTLPVDAMMEKAYIVKSLIKGGYV